GTGTRPSASPTRWRASRSRPGRSPMPRLAAVDERAPERGLFESSALFEASAPFALFDDLRVPYTVSPGSERRLRSAAGRTLRWASPSGPPAPRQLGEAVFRASALDDGAASRLLGRGWEPA